MIAGSIPYDRCVTESLRAGGTMLDISDGDVARTVRDAWESVREMLTSI